MKQLRTSATALAERISAPCPNPYDLMRPVRHLRKALGLTANDLAVLNALVSFLSREDWAKSAHTALPLTVVFASNAALADRANNLDERTLRRCLGRLATAGLVERKASANGKRFPLRYGGMIRDAFGIDMRPLIARYPQLVAMAAAQTQEDERLRSLRAEALALRAAILCQSTLTDADLARLTEIRNTLRRASLTTDMMAGIFAQLRSICDSHTTCHGEREETSKPETSVKPDRQNPTTGRHLDSDSHMDSDLPASNGQTVRHIESQKKESYDLQHAAYTATPQNRAPIAKHNPATMNWADFSNIARYFPNEPRDQRSLKDILAQLGAFLRIQERSLTSALQKAGAGRVLIAFDYLIGKASWVRHPDAYFQQMLEST